MTDRTPPDADVVAAIPDNIRAEMARASMTLHRATAVLGMSPAAFRRRQAVPSKWTYRELITLADALDVSITVLVGGDR